MKEGMGTFVLVDPAAELSAARVAQAPRPATLAGMRVGMIDNSKHMAGPLLKAVETLLRDKYQAAGFEVYRKDNPSIATPPEVLRRMVANCDALVHGVAD